MTATTESKPLLPSTIDIDIDDVDIITINRNNMRTSIVKKIVGGVSGVFCAFVVASTYSKHTDAEFVTSLTKSELPKLRSFAPLTTDSDSICATGLIKAYSISKIFHQCGETCLHEGDFNGIKYPFEMGMKTAGSVINPCQEAGYDTFTKVETHSDPLKFITSTLNMYKLTEK